MVCKKCGYQNSQGATFCAGCGQKLTESNNKTNSKMMTYMGIAIVVLAGLLCLSVFGRKETSAACSVHNWNAASCVKPAICAICQETQGEPLGHQWLTANCTTPKTCNVCGATDGSVLSHTWMDATCTQAKICLDCLQEVGEPLGHKWPGNDHTKLMYCTLCGDSNGGTETPVQSTKTPSEEDLIPFGAVIAYPNDSSYLSHYEIKYVKAPKGHSIYVYWNPDDASSRRKFLLYEDDEVTVLARQGGLSCVIFTDQSGEQQVGWVSSDCLV